MRSRDGALVLRCPNVKGKWVGRIRSRTSEEVRGRMGYANWDVIDGWRINCQRVVTEHGIGHGVRHRQWAPTDVDPVVALVHGRVRRQAEEWVGRRRVRDSRRHLVA